MAAANNTLTAETLAPLKNKGLTLDDVAARFNLSKKELLKKLFSLNVFNWKAPDGSATRVHGTPNTQLFICIKYGRDEKLKDFVVMDDAPFLDVLKEIEDTCKIVRGRYFLTYKYHMQVHLQMRTHRDWHMVCEYYRDLGCPVTLYLTMSPETRILSPAEQEGAGF